MKSKKKVLKFQNAFASWVIPISLVIALLVFYFIMGAHGNFQGNNSANAPIPGNYLGVIYRGGIIVPIIMMLLLTVMAFSLERFFTINKARGKGSEVDFVESLKDFLAEKTFPLNFPSYTEPRNPNKLIVDRVIHYENLTKELGGVFQDLGIPFAGTLGVNAKSEYRTDRRPHQEIYSKKQAKLIRDVFQQEILLHGYKY